MYIHTQPTYILPISSLLIGNSEIGQDLTVITTLNAKYTKEHLKIITPIRVKIVKNITSFGAQNVGVCISNLLDFS